MKSTNNGNWRAMWPLRGAPEWVALALALAVPSAVASETKYTLIVIEPLPGLGQNTPNDLNAKGRVIGFGFVSSSDDNVGCYWFKGGGTRPLPQLPGVFNTWPFSINDRDEIVGQDLLGDPAAPLQIGWFWKPGMKQYSVLKPLRDGDVWVGVNDIDHAGRIVGYSSSDSATVDPVIWESYRHVPTALKGLPGNGASARAINANRPPQLAGVANPWGTDNWLALLWRAPDAAPEVLSGLGAGADVAVSINDELQIAGYSATDPSDPWNSVHAVLWENAHVTDLAPGHAWSMAGNVSCLNNQGQIVGGVLMADGLSHAVLWKKTGDQVKMTDLNAALAEPTTYFLTYADGINDKGWIIADAFDQNDPNAANRAFLLVPSD